MVPITLALALTLVASPAAPKLPKLAAPGFSYLNVDEKTAGYFSEFFAQQLQEAGVSVTTQGAMTALLGFERQKQLLGCSTEQAACLAELAGALGVDALVMGSLGKFGNEYAVTAKIISAKDSATLLAESGRVDGDRALLDWLTATARKMAASLATPKDAPKLQALTPVATASGSSTALVAAAPSRPRGPGLGVWLSGGGGAALLVGSGVTYWLAAQSLQRLGNPNSDYANYQAVQDERFFGEVCQWSSAGLLAAGIASLGASGFLWWRDSAPPALAVVPRDGGAVAVFAGELP